MLNIDACEPALIHTKQLRAHPQMEVPASHLSRKLQDFWCSQDVLWPAHTSYKDADWAVEPDNIHSPWITVHFVSSSMEWSQDKADAEFKAVIREIGGAALVIDASYLPCPSLVHWSSSSIRVPTPSGLYNERCIVLWSEIIISSLIARLWWENHTSLPCSY